MLKVAVILLVYNEARCIAKTWDSILAFSNARPYYHFIFVNDGSTDQTKQILNTKLATLSNCKIKVIEYKNNKGKGFAIKTAVEYVHEDYICFIDSDLAYSLEHLDLLVDKLDKFDIVIGCRNLISKNIEHVSLTRKLAGKIFNIISRKLLSLPFCDMQAGVKGFKKDVAKAVFQKQRTTGFSFDVELIYLAKKKGYKIGQIPAIVSEKHINKVSKVNLLTDSIRMLFDLLQIKYNDIMRKYE